MTSSRYYYQSRKTKYRFPYVSPTQKQLMKVAHCSYKTIAHDITLLLDVLMDEEAGEE